MEIDWQKYGFEKKEAGYQRMDFPLTLNEDGEFLHAFIAWTNGEYTTVSRGRIPATNQAVVLLLKAFNCPKLL